VTSILFLTFLGALIRHCSLPLLPQTTTRYCTSDSASAFEFAGTEQNNTRTSIVGLLAHHTELGSTIKQYWQLLIASPHLLPAPHIFLKYYHYFGNVKMDFGIVFQNEY